MGIYYLMSDDTDKIEYCMVIKLEAGDQNEKCQLSIRWNGLIRNYTTRGTFI
ncbi:hypothetical protein LFU01_37520 [Lysinibacillus fusiformis]|nr:hypothetical protein LFU01_37520 [Lysinibacillus fusiformis]